jgi:hypothetical protein
MRLRYFLILLLCSLPLLAQDVPAAPSHSFFERGSQIRMGLIAGLIAADGITTQHILTVDHGSEMDPLVRPLVVRGAGGQAAASVLGSAFSIGGAYFFHRTGHHKLERLMLNVTIGVEAECVISNLVQIGKAGH